MRIPGWNGTYQGHTWYPFAYKGSLKFKFRRAINALRTRFGWDIFKDE